MGELNRVGDFINFSTLGVILYFGYVRCYHWGKPGEEHKGSFHIISHNCTRICNDLTKSLIKKKVGVIALPLMLERLHVTQQSGGRWLH